MSNRDVGSTEGSRAEMSLEEWIQKEESLVESDPGSDRTRLLDLEGLRTASETVRSSLTELVPAGSDTGIRAEYAGAIRELDRSLDRIVTAGDIERETEYSIDDITDTFGSWRAALDAAGIDIRSQIRIEIARLYRELGHAPSPAEMNANGHISSMMVENNFESYEAAVEEVIPQSETSTTRDVVVARAPQVPDILKRTQESGGQVIDAATTRVDGVSLAELLPQREGQLVPTVPGDGIQPALPDPAGSLKRARETVPEIDEERREFLKYAGVSIALTSAVSSSDNLYGTDTAAEEVAAFGYGGPPILSGPDSETDSQGAAPVSEPTATATPTPSTSGGTTATQSGSQTDDTTTADAPDNTTDSTQSGGSTDGGSTDDGSGDSTVGGSGGSTGGSGGSTDDGSGGSTGGSGGSTDDGSGGSTGGSGGSTDDGSGGSTGGSGGTTPSKIDRYQDNLGVPPQAYGEQGYGGITTA